ncbi:glutamate--tRNA ligase [Steroidobacter sp. S1-65]|uniref:Glutamate--tRNA ligase n=1 Tax=Steroidobacter gossypii TaxID=2805490 RepID=A0ABS1X199_9GAMM|nr:glutamate--tRNA ligase [Steroidobacter gossypii]MBM0106997.1 glutamate--tRNA ligase [Steroidobacter gossypii]
MSSDPPDRLVTRFAPSPTGYLHLGNARTALLNYLAARKAGGRFILRVEDTDEARSSEEFLNALYVDLHWLGIDWDEGPDIGGPHTLYRQQQRRALYDEWLSRLDAAGLTYPCFCTPAELNISRKRQLAAGQPPRYAGTCRNLTSEERAERLARGLPAALRFRVPQGQLVSFVDLVHGEQRFNSDDIGDFIIRRTDGSTAFFFSNAVDDALMDVTLVLRGDDHMTNTPRQILLLQALGLRVPQYAHVALLLGMDGAPLSKRHGDTSLRELRERGYLPGALRNHLVRLGHSCVSDGWLDEAALIADFDLNRLGRAAAKFDDAQLRHWQKETVAHLSTAEFVSWIGAELPAGLDEQTQAQFVSVVRGNVELPADAKAWAKVVFGKLDEFEPAALTAIREAGESYFTEALRLIGQPGADFKPAVKALGQATGKKGPGLFMPLRAALTGFTHGPELAPMLALLPVAEIQARLEHARRLAV